MLMYVQYIVEHRWRKFEKAATSTLKHRRTAEASSTTQPFRRIAGRFAFCASCYFLSDLGYTRERPLAPSRKARARNLSQKRKNAKFQL